ncbi:hypothetical protein [Streptomyces cucumeris]|uniref:hypothetical protein n=1 Tax=Streptomyces cucumeris TaxID=2962890 RepID=UPI0020C938FD|nr:hypothetical protein [Streptomyces sp. NEAU-Y11]
MPATPDVDGRSCCPGRSWPRAKATVSPDSSFASDILASVFRGFSGEVLAWASSPVLALT